MAKLAEPHRSSNLTLVSVDRLSSADIHGLWECPGKNARTQTHDGGGPRSLQLAPLPSLRDHSEELPSTVAVVDDDPSTREALSGLLSSIGWWAETFGSARELLGLLRQESTSCLVLDVRLPDKIAVSLVKKVSRQGYSLEPRLWVSNSALHTASILCAGVGWLSLND